ncbi:MAG TPA: hypothetical protein VFH73_15630 [Polyangia bacterium]|nr:hypothetical protein [Polyangia bacterium]
MKSLTFAVCLLLPVTVRASEVLAAVAPARLALLPVSGTNVHVGYLDAARDLLKDHLLATGRFVAITVPGESGTVEIATDQAVQRGREANAELVLVTHLTRLQGVGRLRIIAYRVTDGSVAHADTIGISGGPDDLDPALKRLADGLASGKPAQQTADIESVTQREADPLLKQSATKVVGVRLGAIVPLSRPAGLDAAAAGGLGIFWLYDARTFLGEIALDLYRGDKATSFDIGIGGFYPFSRGNITPYLGSALSYSITDFGGAGANGLRIQPTFGVLFGRLSTVQVRGQVGYFFNTFGERDGASAFGEVPSSASKTYAHGPAMTIGLGF